jgi:Domain of Unknown Function (DUF1080)
MVNDECAPAAAARVIRHSSSIIRHFVGALLFLAGATLAAEEPPPGFTALFNGRDLKGWRGGDTYDHRQLLAMNAGDRARKIEKWSVELTPHWRVENGEIHSRGVGRFLTTERDYGDFELLAEYHIEPRGDTGIYLRGVPQVQLWDPADPQLAAQGADKGSGGLWNNGPGRPGRDPLVRADKPAGEWNAVRIQMVGSRVSVWLNAQLVVDHARLANFFDAKTPVIERGPIQLQTHGGEVRWRRLFLREIAAPEAHRLLLERGRGPGFRSLWDGREVAGWAGATEMFAEYKGALRARQGATGTMHVPDALSDFIVRMEFMVAPGGSGGLALRYSGEGDPATAGLCKIQMRDEHYEKTGGPIDARQAHGSAYGLVAARRGYQREAGQWNFQEVTVRGATVRVELNGYVILETDLSTAVPAAFLHVGAERRPIRPRGFFGLVAENPGLAIRTLELRKLPAFAQ